MNTGVVTSTKFATLSICFTFTLQTSFKIVTRERRTWGNIKEIIKTSAKESLGLQELKKNKPWFDKECLGFLDHRKGAKMQWIQNPSQSKVDNLNSVRREVSRHFRNKKKAYLRAKIEELETNS